MQRNRAGRCDAAFYRGLLAFCGVPPAPPRSRRGVERPRPVVDEPIVLSSDTSAEGIVLPDQQPPQILLGLDSSIESLPNIDPCPQWQLPVGLLRDLGSLDVTAEILPPPPLQHRVLQEAYVLLQRLQLPPLQPITPPPEPPAREPTQSPGQEVDWVEVEAAVAEFDGQRYLLVPQPLALQQLEVIPVPQHVPLNFAVPPPMQPVDWAGIARALFSLAEEQTQRGAAHPN